MSKGLSTMSGDMSAIKQSYWRQNQSVSALKLFGTSLGSFVQGLNDSIPSNTTSSKNHGTNYMKPIILLTA